MQAGPDCVKRDQLVRLSRDGEYVK